MRRSTGELDGLSFCKLSDHLEVANENVSPNFNLSSNFPILVTNPQFRVEGNSGLGYTKSVPITSDMR